jgi:hypothetical protein
MNKKRKFKGQRIGSRGKRIIVKDMDNGDLVELDPMLCLIKVLDRKKQICIYEVECVV